MILGIGTETAAKDLAHELQGSYNEIPSNPTATQLTQTAGNLFGDVAVQGSVSVSPVAPDGSSRLSFTLQSSGLASDATITLSGVDARTGTRDLGNVLPSPFTFTVRKAGTTSVQVPLKFPAELPADAGATALAFSFSSGLHFAPSSVTISLHPATWVQTNLLLLIVAVAALLVIVAVVLILLWRFTRGRPVRFTVLIEDEPVSPEASTLSGGKELFLNETDGEFALVVRRNARSVARFAVKDGKLSLGVLKQDRFPKLKEPPAEARGKTFVMKSENGRNLSLKVQSEERKK
jgi:hypothetical protein